MKTFVLDIDGVMIMREEYFSVIYARNNNIPTEVTEAFFLKDFKLCSTGKADLKEMIAPYLPNWKWKSTVDEFLRLWFETENKLDSAVLKEVDQLRAKGIPCYIATQQEKYRKNYLWEKMKLKDHFDGIFCTCDVGYTKFEPEFLKHLVDNLKVNPKDVVFFDDKEAGVEKMKEFGIDAHHYKNLETLREQIRKI
jgi:putative hydrolase of the HAD superfamily